MLLALFENKLHLPFRTDQATCPLCKGRVISKIGLIKVHHWAHQKHEGCDSWTEPETRWHKVWKEAFPIENREVVIEKFDQKHFADIFTDNKVVIELQNSSINPKTIREREQFYGNRMLWIINGARFRENIMIFITQSMADILKIKDPNRLRNANIIRLSHKHIDELLSTDKTFTYHWKYPAKSWKFANRPVFIDYNEKYLLWIQTGLGGKQGKLKVFSKKEFLMKYNGDFNIYNSLTDNRRLTNYSKMIDKIERNFTALDHDIGIDKYFVYPRLKVIDNYSKQTALSKVTYKQLLVPNGNSKGILFLYMHHIEDETNVALKILTSDHLSLSKMTLAQIEDHEDHCHYLVNEKWKLDYISTIPLNKIENWSIIDRFVDDLKMKVMGGIRVL